VPQINPSDCTANHNDGGQRNALAGLAHRGVRGRGMNPFERYGETHGSPHEKRRERILLRRRANATLRKRQDEQRQAQRQYRILFKEFVDDFLIDTGEDGQTLIEALDRLSVKDGLWVLAKAYELKRYPRETRLKALRIINHAMMAARERAGLPPFDDPLESKGVFDKVKEALDGDEPGESP
jgi:hypothetical protein